MFKIHHRHISLILILLTSLFIQPLRAQTQLDENNTYLQVARDQLSVAFDKYNDGDISAAKQSLRSASDWLNKAVDHSEHNQVSSEAEKLAAEIDRFRLTLNHSSEQNDIVRFWHRAASLVIRESEQLIHSYIQSSNDSATLKHLLDAKMHFFLAEHDLFVSHDMRDAIQELNDSLRFLADADALAGPELTTRINNLTKKMKELISLTESSTEAWKNDKLIDSLENAIAHVTSAESIATPPTRLRLKSIEQDIQQLKFDLQKTNIKNRYDLIMKDFTQAINAI